MPAALEKGSDSALTDDRSQRCVAFASRRNGAVGNPPSLIFGGFPSRVATALPLRSSLLHADAA